MLKVQNIEVFHGDTQALHGVSLEVKQGELVALIGGNGAGKTTLINTICGIYRPSKGSITFKEIDTNCIPAHRIVGMGIAQVPEGRQLFQEMTVLENLEMGSYRLSKNELSEQLVSVLDFLPKLKERRTQLAGSLSGGEQQMVALGRALMSKPDLLILDEPSLGLAPIIVDLVFEKVQEVNDAGMTVLLIEQDVNNSLSMANRAYVLETGQIVRSGSGQELLNDPLIKEVYLGI